MNTIVRQGIGSAVVRVATESLSPAAGIEAWKAAAKSAASATMAVAGWTGRIVATRATLDAEGKFISVTVRNYKS